MTMRACAFRHYQSTLSHLPKIEKPGIRLDLEAMRKASKKLNHPWKSFPSVLIAGTNGKGSTAALFSEILSVAGLTVGLYTSPHLSSYRERIVVKENGRQLPFDERGWCQAFQTLVDSIAPEDASLTQFELLTLLAFLIFKENKVDLAVLETGLGGRLDATNIVEPIMSLLTPIDHDHHEYLGDRLTLIAREKAGILREGSPAFSIRQNPEVMGELEQAAHRIHAPFSIVLPGILLDMSLRSQRFDYQGKIFEQSLIGAHQVENASLAIEAGRHLRNEGIAVSEESIATGIRKANWAGRLEHLSQSPTVLIDAAHNPHGASRLVETLTALPLRKPHVLVLGILEDKEIEKILAALSPWGDTWILTQSGNPRAAAPDALLRSAKSLGLSQQMAAVGRVGEACRQGLLKLAGRGTLVVAGSLSTAGEARRLLKRKTIA